MKKKLIEFALPLEAINVASAREKSMAKINSALARQRADELEARLRKRMDELEQERHLAPLPPVIIGGALVLPQSLIAEKQTGSQVEDEVSAEDRNRIDQLAVAAVMDAEQTLGRIPTEMPHQNPGYDIESKDPETGRLLFIEVKGKFPQATTVTVSKTQIMTALNKPEDFILAIVEVDGDATREPRYLRQPFQREPDFGVTSVNYHLAELLTRSGVPG